MITLRLLMSVLTVWLALATPGGASESEGAARPKNTVQAKATPDYIALPRMHLAIEVNANNRFRSLDMEVWIHPKGPENLQLASSHKKDIAEALKADLANYNWEAFEDAEAGPKIARKVVEVTVERVSGAKLDDVFIKTLVLK